MRYSGLPRIVSAEIVHDFVVRLTFTDGVVREVDLDPLLRGPVFQELREDPARFRQMRVDSEFGTIVWPNGADMDPDVLHGDFAPAWQEDAQGRSPGNSGP